jgi:phosphoglycerol transferase MdoB-like AlkP superfamily enzyme
MWVAAALVLPACFFYLMEFYTHNPWEEVRQQAQWFNIFLFELAAGILYFLIGRLRTAYRIEAAVAMVYGIANAYVVRFRTNPIVPWDIFSIRTAANVADNYNFMPNQRMVIVTLVFAAVIFGMRFLPGAPRKTVAAGEPTAVTTKKRIYRWLFSHLLPAGVLSVCLVLFCNLLQQEDFQDNHRLYNKLFTPVYMTNVDGLAVTFVMNLAYISIDKPADYSKEEMGELLSSYESAAMGNGENGSTGSDRAGELPNIIVIMDESFADLSVLGDFETNQDALPFLHSLQQGRQNTITGMLEVSVCGGNTANSEFEFLTGNTMAFLPQGSVPYQQYINGSLPSLASWLDELGYTTIAAHPYYSDGWERESVYPWLGFSDSLFLDDFATASRVRKYVSDAGCVDKIIELYEEKEAGKPLFVFNVTMQNHGGYTDEYENFDVDVVAENVQNTSLNQYLSLTKLSDAALEQLITYFSYVDEKTVVVFFGDHQPYDTVAEAVLAQNGMHWNTLDEEQTKLRYEVPYVIWANYEIPEQTGADTSLNYLAAETFQAAGVPLYDYQNYLLELKEIYPVISAMEVQKADGTVTKASEETGEMDIYRKLQYYQLFDRGEEQ